MKKLSVILLVGCLLMNLATAYAAPTSQAVFFLNLNYYAVNGNRLVMDAAPFIQNNRIYVPVRYLAYACGVKEQDINWDPVMETVTLKLNDNVLQMQLGINQAIHNNLVVDLDVAPILQQVALTCRHVGLPKHLAMKLTGMSQPKKL
ncbi:Copper amine oxidase domain protein (fragment) [Desulforamulus hydrothermalis Lam5 = DSM 18033]|uniref:Copper amine oxidase domain protein n=1 Tax=Desulforamulus hydrothermalis Lam5 = DSM 18033 TaxID=1121428 RepID=K8EA41_9FIRM